jgi:hypothetical protein
VENYKKLKKVENYKKPKNDEKYGTVQEKYAEKFLH